MTSSNEQDNFDRLAGPRKENEPVNRTRGSPERQSHDYRSPPICERYPPEAETRYNSLLRAGSRQK